MMCSTLAPDYRYDNSINEPIGNVYCPITKCLGILCVHKKIFQCLGISDYQGPQCTSTCHVRCIPFEEETKSFFLNCVRAFKFFKRHENQFKMLLVLCIVLEVLFETKVCLCPYGDRERWKLLRMSAMQNVLARSGHSS